MLDTFAGSAETARAARKAWRELGSARKAYEELTRDAASAEARLAELGLLAEATEGLDAGREDELRAERERLRHVTDLAAAAAAAANALAPEDGDGASDLAAAAERAVAPLEHIAPELAAAGASLRDAEITLREVASDLHSFLASLEADPGRVEAVEAELDRIADLKRRFRVQTYAELLERGDAARTELAAYEEGHDPVRAAAEEVEIGRAHV